MSDAKVTNPFDDVIDGYGAVDEIPSNANLPAAGGHTDKAMSQIVTAQRVAVKRDQARVLQEIKSFAAAAGSKYYYDIPFKDRKTGKTTHVIGGSIKLAVDLARAYGNCTAEVAMQSESATHWNFIARFIDYEKGFTYTRPFQQRKGQDTGMRDGGRAADMVFQIGASKALRNVVLGALAVYADTAVDEARSGLVEKITKNEVASRDRLREIINEMEIDIRRVERAYGKIAQKWTPADMARIYGELTSIKDGFAFADEIYPALDEGDASDSGGEKENPEAADKPKQTPKANQGGGRKNAATKKKAEPAKEDAPAETKADAAPAEDEAPLPDDQMNDAQDGITEEDRAESRKPLPEQDQHDDGSQPPISEDDAFGGDLEFN